MSKQTKFKRETLRFEMQIYSLKIVSMNREKKQKSILWALLFEISYPVRLANIQGYIFISKIKSTCDFAFRSYFFPFFCAYRIIPVLTRNNFLWRS